MRLIKLLISLVAFSFLCGTLSAQLNKKGYVQVMEVKSDLPDQKNKFTFENDTLRLIYYFWAEKGMVQIGITNKLDDTLYIDWAKSFYNNSFDELSLSPETDLNLDKAETYKEYFYRSRSLKTADYQTMNSAVGPSDAAHRVETITAIKPHSYYMRVKFHLVKGDFFKMSTKANTVTETRSDDANSKTDIYEIEFKESDTPFKFSTSIAYASKRDFSDQHDQKNNFYVTKISEMDVKHFWGVKIGKDADGYPVYKMPRKKSTSFYVAVDKKSSVEYRKSKGLE